MSAGIEKALMIAWDAHKGQKDKGGRPYICHPITVASNLEREDEIIAALLHDVVEDSGYTLQDLKAAGFPEEICQAVDQLTHKDGEDYFSYIRKIKANKIARSVKVQDLLHNSDASRLTIITEADEKRIAKYRKALEILMG